MPPKAKARPTRMVAPGRRPATDRALAAFEERFAKGLGTPLEVPTETAYQAIPTGSMALDAQIGIGGWPKGRICEMWGPEHAGKTTVAMLSAAQAQIDDPERRVAWIDMEQTFDPKWAKSLGVDLDRLYLYRPLTAEDVADAAREFMSSGMFSLVVLDSVGGMISRAEMEKEADQDTVGQVPKIVTRMVKIAAPMAYRNETTVLVINQVRSVIGGFGASESTGGGWALKHVSSVKVNIRSGEPIKARVRGEEVTIGRKVLARVEKNKINGRLGRAEFTLISQPTAQNPMVGVDQVAETFDVAKKFGVLGKGGYSTLPDGARINGRDKSIEHLRDNPGTVTALRAQVLESVIGIAAEDDDEIDPEDMERLKA